jgi:hypothetical protein
MKVAHENKAKVPLLCLPKDTTTLEAVGEFHYMHAADSLLKFNGCTAHQEIHKLYITQH